MQATMTIAMAMSACASGSDAAAKAAQQLSKQTRQLSSTNIIRAGVWSAPSTMSVPKNGVFDGDAHLSAQPATMAWVGGDGEQRAAVA